MMHFENSSQAIYLQIVEYVCEQIIRGEWTEGEKIPSVRELGVALEVNPNTVMRSYEVLKNEQIIFDKRGIGNFVDLEGSERALRYLQKEFTSKALPQVFKTLYLLKMDLEDLKKPFDAFKKKYPTE
ncbi:DNA-binding transcriptional regulator YhcF, GntR family [Arachidicoccus rhizosphaerae]|uniref:DNA-binding transcriptional regulator YhcF, GntR family n=1 Tax=Arachidicoccus rhizosphaerae TaxID=551991 RepID=A0A1H4CWN4_9BACT|nr:GntR family transcriptional regulator [Arachidicoccus rhizosphaerae]SEA64689.1 DNA-binding transcriptional regulator YhcF, GntR family [Arachidicoccus rhizosphaerae]